MGESGKVAEKWAATANKSHTTLSCNDIIIVVVRFLMPHNDADNGHQLATVCVCLSMSVWQAKGMKKDETLNVRC